MIEITSECQLRAMVDGNGSEDLFLLKHSIHCPISAGAFSEFQQFAADHPEVTCAYIDLLGNRAVSDLLTKISKIKHESPQVVQFFEGNVMWTASHNAIKQKALETHIHRPL